MTRKDYVKIAAWAKEWINDEHQQDHGAVYISRLADILSADNPNFDRARFYKACGMEAENNG